MTPISGSTCTRLGADLGRSGLAGYFSPSQADEYGASLFIRQRLIVARGGGLTVAETPALLHKLQVTKMCPWPQRADKHLHWRRSPWSWADKLRKGLKKNPNNNKKLSDPLSEAFSCTHGRVTCLRQHMGWCKRSGFNLIWWSRNHGMSMSELEGTSGIVSMNPLIFQVRTFRATELQWLVRYHIATFGRAGTKAWVSRPPGLPSFHQMELLHRLPSDSSGASCFGA